MKIGINARTFAVDEPGGAVQSVLALSRELAASPGTEVVLFGPPGADAKVPDASLDDTLYPVGSQVYGLVWERTLLPYLAQKHGIDVLYCPNGNAPPFSIPVPVVMCIHDVNAQKGLSSGPHGLYRRLAVPPAARAADALVTVSEFSKREIVAEFGVDPSKVHVVYNGIDPLYLNDDPGEPTELPDEYVLYVGAFNPRKNVSRLVESFSRLKHETDLDHDLVLVGPGNKQIFENLEIDETADVRTPGYLSDRELKFAYRNADAFAYPSLYEGFGLPPLEAMACGTPVVASTAASLPEVLDDAAVLVDPQSVGAIRGGIERVLTDKECQRRLVERGYLQSERFTWVRSKERILSLFQAFT
jgi:glycosyltransferase involved in cell wall biosynthesis